MGHNFGEQRRGTALGSSFDQQLCTAALKNRSFGERLWGLYFRTIERNFGEQLSAATLGSIFREPLWRIALGDALGNRFEAKLLWATALQRCFGEQLWEAASGNRFREQLWQAVRNNLQEQLL